MLRTEAHADQTGGNTAQERNAGDEPERPGRHERPVGGEHGFDHPVLEKELHPLRHVRTIDILPWQHIIVFEKVGK